MSLTIRNKEAHRMAQGLAALTGESMSTAVTAAIREPDAHQETAGVRFRTDYGDRKVGGATLEGALEIDRPRRSAVSRTRPTQIAAADILNLEPGGRAVLPGT